MSCGSVRCARSSAACTSTAAASMSRSWSNSSVSEVRPERVGRADDRQAGDGRELLLERQRDRGRHRLRARAGQLRRDVDDRRVVARQRRDRDAVVGDHAGDDDRDVEQHRHHRPADEELGQVHGVALEVPARIRTPGRRCRRPSPRRRGRRRRRRSITGVPGRRFCRPSRTTRSPGSHAGDHRLLAARIDDLDRSRRRLRRASTT